MVNYYVPVLFGEEAIPFDAQSGGVDGSFILGSPELTKPAVLRFWFILQPDPAPVSPAFLPPFTIDITWGDGSPTEHHAGLSFPVRHLPKSGTTDLGSTFAETIDHQYPLPTFTEGSLTFQIHVVASNSIGHVKDYPLLPLVIFRVSPSLVPAVRLSQRSDGLGANGHARLTSVNSGQLGSAPRVGVANYSF